MQNGDLSPLQEAALNELIAVHDLSIFMTTKEEDHQLTVD